MDTLKKYHTLVAVTVGIIISSFACWIAISISTDYYSVAPFHYDSASYRLQSVELYKIFKQTGFSNSFLHEIYQKDCLDNLIRLVVAPRQLLGTYGHVSVLLPFMALFLCLMFSFIYRHTQSFIASSVGVLVVFVFPMIYDPITGIADFWKENIAAWLLGSAFLAWFRAENFRYRSWTFLSGLLLGLLVVQRSALAVYAAFLFLPIVLVAIFQQTREEGIKPTINRFLYFILPIGLLGGFVAILQWKALYNYYFVAGYDYGTKSQSLGFLISIITGNFGYPQIIFFILVAVFIISAPVAKPRFGSLAMFAWLAIGLPLIVITTGSKYNMFINVWTIMLMVSFSIALSMKTHINKWQIRLLSISFLVILASSMAQYSNTVSRAHEIAKSVADWRQLWDELTDSVMAQPSPHRLSILFYEAQGLFKNHLVFNRNLNINPGDNIDFVGDLWVHDTYYKANWPGLSLPQLIEMNKNRIEEADGTLAIAYAEPKAIETTPSFGWDSKKVAVPYASAMNYYLLNSPNWKPIKTFGSPYGNLCLYKFSRKALTEADRWQDLQGSKSAYSVPLDFLNIPGVKLFSYYGVNSPEVYQGKYAQWLPSGRNGLQLVLYSDRARVMTFNALATPGPSRKDTGRTLLLDDGHRAVTKVKITREQGIEAGFTLKPGLNRLNFSIEEEANVQSVPNGDTRNLMLLIRSPKVMPATEGDLLQKSNIIKGGSNG